MKKSSNWAIWSKLDLESSGFNYPLKINYGNIQFSEISWDWKVPKLEIGVLKFNFIAKN